MLDILRRCAKGLSEAANVGLAALHCRLCNYATCFGFFEFFFFFWKVALSNQHIRLEQPHFIRFLSSNTYFAKPV